MTNEQLLADIRNKIQPAANLVALVDDYFKESQSAVSFAQTHDYIKEELPKALEAIEYLRNIKL